LIVELFCGGGLFGEFLKIKDVLPGITIINQCPFLPGPAGKKWALLP